MLEAGLAVADDDDAATASRLEPTRRRTPDGYRPRPRRRRPSAPTSRSSSAISTAAAWRTSTRAATSLKPRVVAEAINDYMTRYSRQHPPRRLPDRRRGDRGLRGRAQVDRLVHQRAVGARDRHGPQRDRGHQPRRLLVGPQEHRARRDTIVADRDGAPLEPHPVAAARPRRRTPTWSSCAIDDDGRLNLGFVRDPAAHAAQAGCLSTACPTASARSTRRAR